MFKKDNHFFTKYYKIDFMVLRCIGGWLINDETSYKLIWKIYLFTVNVLFAFLVNFVQILHLFELSNLMTFASTGYLIAVACMASIKAYYVFMNRKDFLLLIEDMKKNTFLPRNKYQATIAMKAMHSHRNTKYIIALLCTLSVIASIITPIFSYRERRLIFPAWYPFDLSSFPLYVFVYVHQVIADLYISYMNIYVELLIAGFTTFVGIQCDFLCYNLVNLTEDELEIGLRECIYHHKLILR